MAFTDDVTTMYIQTGMEAEFGIEKYISDKDKVGILKFITRTGFNNAVPFLTCTTIIERYIKSTIVYNQSRVDFFTVRNICKINDIELNNCNVIISSSGDRNPTSIKTFIIRFSVINSQTGDLIYSFSYYLNKEGYLVRVNNEPRNYSNSSLLLELIAREKCPSAFEITCDLIKKHSPTFDYKKLNYSEMGLGKYVYTPETFPLAFSEDDFRHILNQYANNTKYPNIGKLDNLIYKLTQEVVSELGGECFFSFIRADRYEVIAVVMGESNKSIEEQVNEHIDNIENHPETMLFYKEFTIEF